MDFDHGSAVACEITNGRQGSSPEHLNVLRFSMCPNDESRTQGKGGRTSGSMVQVQEAVKTGRGRVGHQRLKKACATPTHLDDFASWPRRHALPFASEAEGV